MTEEKSVVGENFTFICVHIQHSDGLYSDELF